MNYLDIFKEISLVPRGSGNMEPIKNYCVEFAEKYNLSYVADEFNNVIIYKAPSKGYEDKEPIIIQAHLDMVAEKEPDSCHDFIKDGLKLEEREGMLYAAGTTLGADNGIGVAYILSVLADDTLKHPFLTGVLTSDEETGMDGVKNLDMSLLKGKKIINLDNDVEDILFAGCAGGKTLECTFLLDRVEVSGIALDIQIEGLKGGHSGAEIHKERANSNLLMGRALKELLKLPEVYLCDMAGGNKDNAIPRATKASIICGINSLEECMTIIKKLDKTFKNEYKFSDEQVAVFLNKKEQVNNAKAISKACSDKLISFLDIVPNGVFAYTEKPIFMVETSCNMGVLYTTESSCYITISVRSSINSRKEYLSEKIIGLVELLGGSTTTKGEYPEWEYKADSRLQEVFKRSYESVMGKEPKVEAIHAGLECGYFSKQDSDFDIISFGPNIYDIHTTYEHFDISSGDRMYQVFVKVLENEE